MSIPVSADADPDAMSQTPWPAARHRQRTSSSGNLLDHTSQPSSETTATSYQTIGGRNKAPPDVPEPKRVRFSTWDLFTLSVSMAGAQVTWTVELGYGTPFLLSLGISEQVTSLVWLAGPISGLVAQPLIGAISDSSSSRYRRRYWVVLSTAALIVATSALAYCKTIAAFFVDLYGGGFGDWDPERAKQVTNGAIGIAVVAFYLLDFALNALQASLRNLLLDVTPPEQLNAGNAWHSRMTQAGNIMGYGFGFLPLAKLPFLNFLGGDQFSKFCVISIAILVITVWTTCWFHEEKESAENREKQNKLSDILENIQRAITTLPRPVRKVCIVQLFAFMGWFPFLFYSTTYVGQIMAYQLGEEPDIELATRAGEFAMLLYSIVAVIAGVLLPRLALRDTRLLPQDGDDERHTERLRMLLGCWREEASISGRPLRLPRMPLLLREIWMGAMLLFSVLMFSTTWIVTVPMATVMISLVGICWAVACWVPFAIIMEILREMSECQTQTVRRSDGRAPDECDPLLQSSPSRRERGEGNNNGETPTEGTQANVGGTILGIHNLAIVMPQFIIALVSSAIFYVVDSSRPVLPDLAPGLFVGSGGNTSYHGKNGVAWVLRFGGLCTLVGAFLARTVPRTKSERELAASLATLKALKDEEEA